MYSWENWRQIGNELSMFVGWSDMKFNFFSQVKNQAWALWCTGKKKGVKKAYP